MLKTSSFYQIRIVSRRDFNIFESAAVLAKSLASFFSPVTSDILKTGQNFIF